MVKDWIKRNSKLILGVFTGAALGWGYWNFVGCASGSCSITSVWYNSTIYGAMLGGFVVSSFTKKPENSNDLKYKNENDDGNK